MQQALMKVELSRIAERLLPTNMVKHNLVKAQKLTPKLIKHWQSCKTATHIKIIRKEGIGELKHKVQQAHINTK